MALPKVEEVEQQLHESVELFEAVTGTPVPATLREAVSEGWELVSSGVLVGLALHYNKEQREQDSRRIITVQAAFDILHDYEEQLIKDHVLDVVDISWKYFEVVGEVIAFIWGNAARIWELIELELNFLAVPSEADLALGAVTLARGYAASLALVVAAFKANDFSAIVLSVMKQRDVAAKQMRKRAFPQSTGPRYRRRKLARL